MMFFTLDGFVSKTMFETRSGSSFLCHILRHLIIGLRGGSHSRRQMSPHVRSRPLPGLRWGLSARFSIQQKFDFCPFHKARSWSHWLMVRLSGTRREPDYQWYLAEQSPPVLPCSRASLTAFMTVAYLSAMCILKLWIMDELQIISRRRTEEKGNLSGFRLFCWLWSALEPSWQQALSARPPAQPVKVIWRKWSLIS